MDDETRGKVENLIRNKVIEKVDNYEPETNHKPFYSAIFSEENIFKASILQSMYTSFGMSIWEQMAKILAEGAGYKADTQFDFSTNISRELESEINHMHKKQKQNQLEPDRNHEISRIKNLLNQDSKDGDHPDKRVDVLIEKPDGVYYFDITTVKPNKKEFQVLKKKLMVWMALSMKQKDKEPYPRIAIPYNPYSPEPYSRWTKANLYDSNQLMVGRDFWNFCAGEEAYDELLEIFNKVGEDVNERINDKLDQNQEYK